MRYTISSVAILATSLFVAEVFAVPHQHAHKHKRAIVTEEVIVTEMVTVTGMADGTFETGLPVAVGTTTIDGTPVVTSSTPVATPSSSTAVALPTSVDTGAIFQQTPVAVPTSTTSTSSTPAPTPTPEPTTSTPVVVPTTMQTKTSATPVSTPVATSNSGKKRGLAYNVADLLSGFLSSDSKVDWCYNWGSYGGNTPSGLEFVPLLWGLSSVFTSVWNDHANAAIAAGATALMSFNEPDLAEQANIGVSDAVSGYMTYMQPFAGKAKLGAPAVTNGGSPMGLTYLKSFMSGLEAQGGTVDFCSIHWYDSAANVDYFKSYMQDATAACGGKPIWITEFGASGSAQEQQTFLETVMPWMDQQSFIERYAYFMVTPGTLISSGNALSALGNTFATFV